MRTLQRNLTTVGARTRSTATSARRRRVAVRTWEERSEGCASTAASPAPTCASCGRQVRAGTRLDGRAAAPGGTAAPEQSELLATAEAVAVPAGAGATIGPDGLAIPPAATRPTWSRRSIAAGNEIHGAPYKYGGGHGIWDDSGYDCSGSISYALHGAGLLKQAARPPPGSCRGARRGRAPGSAIYANPGHAYMVVAGLRFDTSGPGGARLALDGEMRDSDGYAVTASRWPLRRAAGRHAAGRRGTGASTARGRARPARSARASTSRSLTTVRCGVPRLPADVEQGDQEADHAHDHQDQADGGDLDSRHGGVDGEAQDRPGGDEEEEVLIPMPRGLPTATPAPN